MKQSEIVARQISQQIIVNDLAEGTRLPPEKVMVEEYQVGRSTLREALRLLENRGVLSIKTGREGGPVVRRPRASDLGEAISLIVQFDGIPPEQVSAAQRALAPRLVRLAAAQISLTARSAMSECLERMELYVDQVAVFEAESRRFHAILTEAAHSPVLAILISAVDKVLDGFRSDELTPQAQQAARDARGKLTAIHKRLYEALSQGDGDSAAAATIDLVNLADPMSPPARGGTGARRGVRGATRARRAGERTA